MQREDSGDSVVKKLQDYRRAPEDRDRAQALGTAIGALVAQDPPWTELAGAAKPDATAPDAVVLVTAAMAWLQGRLPMAIRHLSVAAAPAAARPEMNVLWTGLREAIALSLQESVPVAVRANGALITGIVGVADAAKLALKASRLLELAGQCAPDAVVLRWELLLRRAAANPPEDIGPLLKDLMQHRNVPEVLPPRRLLALSRALARMPDAERLDILNAMTRGRIWTAHRKNLIESLVKQMPVVTESLRRPLIGRLTEEVHVSAPGDAGVTMIVFCGLGHGPAAPLAQFDMFLAQRGIRAIYLVDRQGQSYIKGLKSLGGNRSDMFRHLRRLVAEQPGDRVVTVGFSMSAIAATATALMLKAEAVLNFAGYISGAGRFLDAIGDVRNPGYAEEAERLARRDVDLRAWFARHDHRPLIHMHFAEGIALDRAHAAAIADIEGVSLFPQPGHREHRLPAEMMLRGSFAPALDQILAALPAVPERRPARRRAGL